MLTAILSKIGLGALGVRGKVFLGIILTLVVLGSLLWWRYDDVKESLILANKEIEDIAKELRTSENTIDELERDIKLVSELLKEKEEDRRESRERADRLSQALQNEVNNNEDLEMCLDIDMSEYVDSLSAIPDQNND